MALPTALIDGADVVVGCVDAVVLFVITVVGAKNDISKKIVPIPGMSVLKIL